MDMGNTNGFWKVAGIMTAASVGDGVFALPFVFYQAGWLICIGYLVILGAIVVSAHTVYFKTLMKVGEKERLLGLARKYFGASGFWVGFAAIVIGLLLTLVAYLILGSEFIHLGFPGLSPGLPLAIFWLFIATTVLIDDTRIVELELMGILFTSTIIGLIFLTALPHVAFSGAPAIHWRSAFLPFGAVLFSLAGWTGIEPAYESRKGLRRKFAPWRALATGSLFAIFLYIMFAAGILGTAPNITPDTISGLAGWAAWKRDIIAALGLFAVATVSMPISREIKNSLEKDLRWNKVWSRGLIIFFPIACVLAGLNNFLTVVGIVGGVFLSTQYLLMISVGRRALSLPTVQKILLDLAAIVFAAAAVYQIVTFIVR
jgi:amino acid permease